MKRLLRLLVFGVLTLFLFSNFAFAASTRQDTTWPFPLNVLCLLTVVPIGAGFSLVLCPAAYIINQDGSIPDTFRNYYASLLSPVVMVKVKEDRYEKAVQGKLWKERLQEEERRKEQVTQAQGAAPTTEDAPVAESAAETEPPVDSK